LPSALFFDFRDSLSVTSADVQTAGGVRWTKSPTARGGPGLQRSHAQRHPHTRRAHATGRHTPSRTRAPAWAVTAALWSALRARRALASIGVAKGHRCNLYICNICDQYKSSGWSSLFYTQESPRGWNPTFSGPPTWILTLTLAPCLSLFPFGLIFVG
jgi:hypothetical protein